MVIRSGNRRTVLATRDRCHREKQACLPVGWSATDTTSTTGGTPCRSLAKRAHRRTSRRAPCPPKADEQHDPSIAAPGRAPTGQPVAGGASAAGVVRLARAARRERELDVSALRDQPAHVLPLAGPLPTARAGDTGGSVELSSPPAPAELDAGTGRGPPEADGS